jgi:outer membrane protein assembly factor BamC
MRVHSLFESRLSRWSLICAAGLLSACSSVQSLLDGNQGIDYRSAAEQRGPQLEVPPDLTQLSRDSRYAVPQRASTTFNEYQAGRPATGASGSRAQAAVLPVRPDMRIERSGNQRWLVVNAPPEQLYPVVREFWQEMGFLIRIDLPEAGIMETDWAENRAKIPEDFIRRSIGRIFDSLYSTGERDKFRTRLERVGGGTEIYISHRGAVEELQGTTRERVVWTMRDPDPELEAEFLSRLMIRLGVEQERARVMTASATPVAGQPRAQLVGTGASQAVELNESFDRAWRRVGLVLDRTGFTVEDRNRSQGVYFVRYVDPERDANNTSERGFFGKLFSFNRSDRTISPEQYRIVVADGGSSSRVSVQNAQGQPLDNAASRRILSLLQEQLRQ